MELDVTPLRIGTAEKALLSQAKKFLRETSNQSSHSAVLLPLRFPLHGSINPLDWLVQFSAKEYSFVFFQGRDGRYSLGGVKLLPLSSQIKRGSTERDSDLLQTLTEDSPFRENSIVLEGRPFHESQSDHPFRTAQTAAPSIALLKERRIGRTESTSLVLQALVTREESDESIIERFSELLAFAKETFHFHSHSPSVALPLLSEFSLSPSHSTWQHKIALLKKHFLKSAIRKVVLARTAKHRFPSQFSPFELFRDRFSSSHSSYGLYWQHSPELAFGSVSPERLFSLNGDLLSIDSLAGTRKTIFGESERAAFLAMKNDRKLRTEQQLVTDDLVQQVSPLLTGLPQVSPVKLRRLGYVDHLFTEITGQVRTDISYSELVQTLHPSAAVCGFPRESSKKLLLELEEFERGWYSGPVGVTLGNHVEFLVALRSFLFESDTLTLYSGAGILPSSNALTEWEELDAKLCPYLRGPHSIQESEFSLG